MFFFLSVGEMDINNSYKIGDQILRNSKIFLVECKGNNARKTNELCTNEYH